MGVIAMKKVDEGMRTLPQALGMTTEQGDRIAEDARRYVGQSIANGNTNDEALLKFFLEQEGYTREMLSMAVLKTYQLITKLFND